VHVRHGFENRFGSRTERVPPNGLQKVKDIPVRSPLQDGFNGGYGPVVLRNVQVSVDHLWILHPFPATGNRLRFSKTLHLRQGKPLLPDHSSLNPFRQVSGFKFPIAHPTASGAGPRPCPSLHRRNGRGWPPPQRGPGRRQDPSGKQPGRPPGSRQGWGSVA
jgi:hypothetical protein